MSPAAPNETRIRLVEAAGKSIARGSKSFRFASQIFDLATRERSWLLYAWCRACDDITDGQTLGHDAQVPDHPDERIAFIREHTDAALTGQTTGLVPFDALMTVAVETGIPADLPHDHLAGFARDAAGWSPRTEDELLSYCYQVAGVVGVMMAHVMGVDPDARDPLARDTLDRASDLGIAFQLANIARDIADDAQVGRSYIPTDWMLDPASADDRPEIASRLAALAERYRASSRVGAARLPFRSRWAVLSAGRIYGAVGTRAAALGPRAWDKRIVISKGEKLAMVVAALFDALLPAPQVNRDGLWTRARESAPRRGSPARPSAPRPAARRGSRS